MGQIPPHPGEMLKTILDPTGLSTAEIAKKLGITELELVRVYYGEGRITAELAVRLEAAGVTTAQAWLGIQLIHDLWEVKSQPMPEVERLVDEYPEPVNFMIDSPALPMLPNNSVLVTITLDGCDEHTQHEFLSNFDEGSLDRIREALYEPTAAIIYPTFERGRFTNNGVGMLLSVVQNAESVISEIPKPIHAGQNVISFPTKTPKN